MYRTRGKILSEVISGEHEKLSLNCSLKRVGDNIIIKFINTINMLQIILLSLEIIDFNFTVNVNA